MLKETSLHKIATMAEFTKPSILLIDDDPLVRRIIVRTLVAEGYRVTEAGSGTEGLELAFKNPPDLILLDLVMPGMDGFEVCAALRRNPATTNIPILMLTALDQIDSRLRGLQTGADDYITKPFNMEELRTRVLAHLRRRERDLSANPLTALPGNTAIEHLLRQRLAAAQPLAVLYIDLSNFKEYNDQYGWLQGDRVIKLLAQLILEAVRTQGGPEDFVGHIGGDDFVVLSTPAHAEGIAKTLIARFDSEVPAFYSDEARARGYIEVVDRRGHLFRAALMSVSIAIVTNEHTQFHHPGQIAARAAEVKRYVKSLPGSQYAFDRRR